jgi:hypothetical protein
MVERTYHDVGRIKNSCPLSINKKNENRHLVFWLLGTLIGLIVKALIV